MNNHIKTCPYCQGDGVVYKNWEDIEIGDILYYKGIYINSQTLTVRVVNKGEEHSIDYWIVCDNTDTKFSMFKINFKGHVP